MSSRPDRHDDNERACPKCGFVQPPTKRCVSCGVEFAAFEAHWTSETAKQAPAAEPKPAPVAPRAIAPDRSATAGPRVARRLAMPVSGQAAQDVYAGLGALLQAGIDAAGALQLLATGSDGRVKRALQTAAQDVAAGAALGEAMSRAPALFSQAEAAAVAFAERTGQLAMSLRALSRGVGERLKLKRQLAQSLLFPFVVVAMHALLSPISLLLRDNPAAFSTALGRNIALLTLTVVVTVWGLPMLLHAHAVASRLRAFGWRVPWLAAFFIHHSRALFCHALADSLEAGMTPCDALRSAAAICGDPGIDKRIERVITAIEGGANLALQLDTCALIGRRDTMLAVAAETLDALPDTLRLLSERYAELWRSRLKILTSALGTLLAIAVLVYAVSSLMQGYSSITSSAGDLLNNVDLKLDLPGL